jgi:hypothetical protein
MTVCSETEKNFYAQNPALVNTSELKKRASAVRKKMKTDKLPGHQNNIKEERIPN